MLRHEIVPVQGHPPHTHGVQIIEDGPYMGLKFVFGKIEFMGEDKIGQGRFRYDYEILEPSLVGPVDEKELEREIGDILAKIIEDSATTAEVEERTREVNEAKARAAALPDTPVVFTPEGESIEFVEVMPDDGGTVEMVQAWPL